MINVKQNNRYYLDFNATSPYSRSVEHYLKAGSYLYGNPSSIHMSGKRSKRFLRETTEQIEEEFSLNEKFRTFFHSGATEGINTLLFGAAKYFFKNKQPATFFVFATDHSSVFNQQEEMEMLGHTFVILPVNDGGDFEYSQIENIMQKFEGPKVLNFTWVNNETGVCWALEDAIKLKQATDCYVHVDAVQAVGKIANWNKISLELDAYTFSAHKFGGMKGVGFSFVKTDYPFRSLLRGGGQQSALRSGTENVDGIYSISLALNDVNEDFNPKELSEAKTFIENQILDCIEGQGQLIGSQAKNRNLNTIYIVMNKHKADITTTAFDIAGMDVSSGSACSSGSILPSRVLLAMGIDEQRAKSALRFSFPYNFTLEEAKELAPKLIKILERFC